MRVRLLLSALLAAAIFWFLLTRVHVAGVWAELRAMTWVELLTVAAVAAWNLVTTPAAWKAWPFGRGNAAPSLRCRR
jgi:hypothetical protein